jgi:hypothetical protein
MPRRVFGAEDALALPHYRQRRNAVAVAHRKRQDGLLVGAGDRIVFCVIRRLEVIKGLV